MITTIIISALGIISTLLAWFLSPQRKKDKLYSQLDQVYKNLEELYNERDKALVDNNNDKLTIILDNILKLRQTKADLLQRLR